MLMPYTITVSQNNKYIIVRVTDDMSRKLAAEIAEQALLMGKKWGTGRYLIDLTASRNRESILGSYLSAYEDLAEVPWRKTLTRVALLVDPQDNSHDFNEIVLNNIGMRATLFRDRDEALQYLLED